MTQRTAYPNSFWDYGDKVYNWDQHANTCSWYTTSSSCVSGAPSSFTGTSGSRYTSNWYFQFCSAVADPKLALTSAEGCYNFWACRVQYWPFRQYPTGASNPGYPYQAYNFGAGQSFGMAFKPISQWCQYNNGNGVTSLDQIADCLKYAGPVEGCKISISSWDDSNIHRSETGFTGYEGTFAA